MNFKKTSKGTFLGPEINPSIEESDAAMLGIGFDLTASYAKGTAQGPRAIIEASRQVEYEIPVIGTRLDEKAKVHNLGLLGFSFPKKLSEKQVLKETRKMVETAKKELRKAVGKNKFLVVFGGDHSTTNATLEAVCEKIDPKKICWLRLDAHLDLRNALDNNQLSHGSIGRRIFDRRIKQVFVGIRDHISGEEAEFIAQKGLADDIFYFATQPKKFYDRKMPAWMKKENISFENSFSAEQVKKILQKINKEFLFINIDIDILDANEFPGTGTPMPSGMSWKGINELLFEAIGHARKNGIKIIGFDIVEVFPVLKDYKKPYSLENALLSGNEMKAAMLAYNLLLWDFIDRF